MRILITGATGFLGKNLVKKLQLLNYTITVIGRDIEKLNEVFKESIIIKKAVDYSIKSLIEVTCQQDIVIHLASQLMQRNTDPLKISQFDQNSHITENLLIASHQNGIKKFINTSSISVYHIGNNLREDVFLTPSNIYGVSKAALESYLGYFQGQTNVDIITLRLARLYGHGERSGLMFTDFVNKAIHKQTLTVNGTGSSTVEYIYIEDVVEIIAEIIKKNKVRGAYNIGNGVSYSVGDIATIINDVFDNQGNIVFIRDKPDGILGTTMNVSKAKSELEWSARWDLRLSILDIKNKIEKKENGK